MIFPSVAKLALQQLEEVNGIASQGLGAAASLLVKSKHGGDNAHINRAVNLISKMAKDLNAAAALERHFTRLGTQGWVKKFDALICIIASDPNGSESDLDGSSTTLCCSAPEEVPECKRRRAKYKMGKGKGVQPQPTSSRPSTTAAAESICTASQLEASASPTVKDTGEVAAQTDDITNYEPDELDVWLFGSPHEYATRATKDASCQVQIEPDIDPSLASDLHDKIVFFEHKCEVLAAKPLTADTFTWTASPRLAAAGVQTATGQISGEAKVQTSGCLSVRSIFPGMDIECEAERGLQSALESTATIPKSSFTSHRRAGIQSPLVLSHQPAVNGVSVVLRPQFRPHI